MYLQQCQNDTQVNNEASIEKYQQFLRLDSKFGANESHQLHQCVIITLRLDFIQVKFKAQNPWISVINRKHYLKKFSGCEPGKS